MQNTTGRASIAYEHIVIFSQDCLQSILAGHFQSRENEKMHTSPLDTHYFQVSIGHTLQTAYYLTDVNGVKKLEQVAEEKDLGILYTDDMKWSNNSTIQLSLNFWFLQPTLATSNLMYKHSFPEGNYTKLH